MRSLITGCILAGGKGTRIGGDKLWKQFRGRNLIDYPVRLIESMDLEGLAILADDQPPADALLLQRLYPKLKLVSDFAPTSGPLVGIATALAKSQTPWILVLPIDMPEIHFSDLEPLIEHTHREELWAIVSSVDQQLQPLVGLYSKLALPSILQHLETGARGPKGWVTKHANQCLVMPALEPQHWKNVNDPQGLES